MMCDSLFCRQTPAKKVSGQLGADFKIAYSIDFISFSLSFTNMLMTLPGVVDVNLLDRLELHRMSSLRLRCAVGSVVSV